MSVNFIDLTTVAAVNNLLAQASGTDSDLIQTEITNLSRYILTKTSRNYLGGFLNYSETYNGNGSDTLMLKNYPILAVSSLVIGTMTIPQSPGTNQSGWVIDTSGGGAALALRGWGRSNVAFSNWNTGDSPWSGYGNAPPLGQGPYGFYEGVMNVAVAYTAGMVTDQRNEQHTVPATGSYAVTVTNSTTFWSDLGVTTTTGVAVTGYTVINGVYTFPSSYAGQNLLFNYQYGAVPQDLNECATKVVATYYRRPKYLDQTSQMQPGIGTTAYSRSEWSPECTSIIEKYMRRFLD